ncbi:MAG: cupin domain-containing protein [bacterium]|nr:cupin domain-containing protein [bacterium]MDD5756901.1 cupin domain-containing protein [bacterium]
MRLSRSKIILSVLGLCFITFSAAGAETIYNVGVQSKIVLQATQDVVGQEIAYPKVEHPEVTGMKVTIPSGQETGWHTHSMPGYAYVLSGTITLEYEKGITKQFKPGEAFAEVVNVSHNGRNNGTDDVVLVVFFTGEKGIPFTKKKETKKVN